MWAKLVIESPYPSVVLSVCAIAEDQIQLTLARFQKKFSHFDTISITSLKESSLASKERLTKYPGSPGGARAGPSDEISPTVSSLLL